MTDGPYLDPRFVDDLPAAIKAEKVAATARKAATAAAAPKPAREPKPVSFFGKLRIAGPITIRGTFDAHADRFEWEGDGDIYFEDDDGHRVSLNPLIGERIGLVIEKDAVTKVEVE